MDWTSLYGNSIGAQQLNQYPSKQVYNAATLLTPQERPTVPVRVSKDYEKDYARFGGVPGMNGRALPEGFTPPSQDEIYVNSRMPSYNDKGRLAATIAHEGYHAQDQSNDPQPTREYKARLRELGVLDRLGKYQDLTSRIRSTYGIK